MRMPVRERPRLVASHVSPPAPPAPAPVTLPCPQVIPKDSPLRTVIDRVREEAENMPTEQLHRQLASQLGHEWRGLLADFDDEPLAAASIGQVPRPTTSTP